MNLIDKQNTSPAKGIVGLTFFNTISVIVFGSALCGVNGRDQNALDLKAIGQKRGRLLFVKVIGLLQNMEPILGLSCLLQRDLKLGNEISPALPVLRLVDIRANGRAGAEYLLGENSLVFFLNKIPVQLNDASTKVNGFFY